MDKQQKGKNFLVMDKAICLLCGSDQIEDLFQARDFRLNDHKETFKFVKCNKCNLIFQYPLPAEKDMIAHYNQNVLYKNPKDLSKLRQYLHNYGLKKRSEMITHNKKQGLLLDIGCGTGSFLAYMAQHTHLEVTGTEINERNVAFIKNNYSFPVYLGDLQQLAFPKEHFDVITMWDVIEHLPNPKELLTEIHKILKPNGYLVIRVPNGNSFDFKLFGKYWAGVDAPRHYLIYTKQTLSVFLENSGFSVVSGNSRIGSYFNFLTSLEFRLKDTKIKPKTRNFLLRTLSTTVVRAILFPIFWIKDLLTSGTSLTVIAKPNSNKSTNDK